MAKKILVIDDEADMLGLVSYTLEKAGYQVATCDNGRQAWDMIVQTKPDLLILDVMLPGIDGYSLQLKVSQDEATKDIPIIILTALEPSKTLFQKFPQVKAFLTKPFRTEGLLKSVSEAVGQA